MGLEEVLESLGSFGPWQVFTFVLICMFSHFPGMWQLYAIIFIGHPNPYHCQGKGAMLNQSVPWEQDFSGQWGPAKCKQFTNFSLNNDTEDCTNFYIDTDDFDPDRGTILMEWGLTCEKEPLILVSQIIFSVGVLLGFCCLSPISDKFGRKPTMFWSLLLTNIFGAAMGFSPTFEWLCVFQFITGFFASNTYLTGFVIACELFPTSVRSITAPATYVFESIGIASLSIWATFIRSWREFQFAISVAAMPFLIYYWFCPESLRWLMANGQVKETQMWLDKAAKFNRKTIQPGLLTKAFTFDKDGKLMEENKVPEKQHVEGQEVTLRNYFRHPKLVMYTCVTTYLWTVNTLIYFGISYMNAVLAGDRYLNFALIGLLELVGILMATILNQILGRRYPLFVFHFLSAAFLACAAGFDAAKATGTDIDPIYTTVFVILGKFAVSGCTCTESVYVQELYPTKLRSTAVGLMMGIGFIGGIIAPAALFVARATAIYVPVACFAAMAFIGSFMGLLLPETFMRDLPESIEEVLAYPRAQSKEEKKRLKMIQGQRRKAKMDVIKGQEAYMNSAYAKSDSQDNIDSIGYNPNQDSPYEKSPKQQEVNGDVNPAVDTCRL